MVHYLLENHQLEAVLMRIIKLKAKHRARILHHSISYVIGIYLLLYPFTGSRSSSPTRDGLRIESANVFSNYLNVPGIEKRMSGRHSPSVLSFQSEAETCIDGIMDYQASVTENEVVRSYGIYSIFNSALYVK